MFQYLILSLFRIKTLARNNAINWLCLFTLISTLFFCRLAEARWGDRTLPDVQQTFTRPLTSGEPIQHEMTSGQIHFYSITLTTDQFLKVQIDQRGIDLEAQLLGAAGQEIAEWRYDAIRSDRKFVELVIQDSGAYQLRVRPTQKDAEKGSYEIQILELRPATKRDQDLEQIRRLNQEGLTFSRSDKYPEAIQKLELACQLGDAFGEDHPEIAISFDRLGNVYNTTREFQKEEPLLLRAQKIREKIFGTDHPEYAVSLESLANHYRRLNGYENAARLFSRVLEIRQKHLGADHFQTARVIQSLANNYSNWGDFSKATPLFQRALELYEKKLAPEHNEKRTLLNNLGNFYYNNGEYAKAEVLYLQNLEAEEKTSPLLPARYSNVLNNLANVYLIRKEYDKAETLFQRSLEFAQKAFEPDSLQIAVPLNSLAVIYSSNGNYAKAEELLQRALDIRVKKLPLGHSEIGLSFQSLGNLYLNKGDYVKAETFYQQAYENRVKNLKPENPEVTAAMNNLGAFYFNIKDYEKAELYYSKALEIREKKPGPEATSSLLGLADLYLLRGDNHKAEEFYERARVMSEAGRGEKNFEIATILQGLGNVFLCREEYTKAEAAYSEALNIQTMARAANHPGIGSHLNSLVRLYYRQGEAAKAMQYQAAALSTAEYNIRLNLGYGSERAKLAYLATLSSDLDQAISIHTQLAPNNPEAINVAATLILQRKGRTLDAMAESLASIQQTNPENYRLLAGLKETNSRLSKLILNGKHNNQTDELYQSNIQLLQEEREKYEETISKRSAAMALSLKPFSLATIQQNLPPDTALIEFFAYQPLNRKFTKWGERYDPPHYIAYVIRNKDVRWAELGEAKAIDKAIAEFRESLRDYKRRDTEKLARIVDEKVMQPLRPFLNDTPHLLISPDGAINLIPFAALVDEQGKYLVARHNVSYLTNGRDLLRLQIARETRTAPLLVADPLFGEPEGEMLAQVETPKHRPSPRAQTRAAVTSGKELSEMYFNRLRQTAIEAEAIKKLFPQAKALTAAQATESALKQVAAPSILHVATHGFFLSDQPTPTATGTRNLNANVRIENPLLRSGLALTGANLRKGNREEDGILTAMEVAGLNLWGTKLVVLSGCETGLGDVKNGEGVHGLRRALILAGSETQVMSLWKVNDRVTRDWMTTYYTGLKKGLGRGEALRQVQLQMLKDPNRQHPYYWASFIQSGEWGTLEGKR